jgi:carboxylesterase type B
MKTTDSRLRKTDGDFLTDFPSFLTKNHQFLKIPLVTGTNTDEGTSFSSKTVTTNTSLKTWLQTWRSYNLSPTSISRLLSLYENYKYPPYHAPSQLQFSGTGAMWRKSGAIGGDLVMMSQRRKMAEAYTDAGVKVWSFQFDTPRWDAKPLEGANHGAEVAFTLQNNTGTLGALPEYLGYRELSEGIGRAYVNFVNFGNPNGGNESGIGVGQLPYWPSYGERKVNMVLNANKTEVEEDDWRKEGIEFINGISRELLA